MQYGGSANSSAGLLSVSVSLQAGEILNASARVIGIDTSYAVGITYSLPVIMTPVSGSSSSGSHLLCMHASRKVSSQAISVTDGALTWTWDADAGRGAVFGDVLVLQGVGTDGRAAFIFGGRNDGSAHAVGATDGEKIWSWSPVVDPASADLNVAASVAENDVGAIVIPTWFADLYVVSLASGALLSSFPFSDFWIQTFPDAFPRPWPAVISSLQLLSAVECGVGSNVVCVAAIFSSYFVGGSSRLGVLAVVALPLAPVSVADLASCVRWNISLSQAVGGDIVYWPSETGEGSLLLVPSFQPVLSFSAKSGALRWTGPASIAPPPPTPNSAPYSVSDALIAAGSGTGQVILLYVASNAASQVVALDATTGAFAWRSEPLCATRDHLAGAPPGTVSGGASGRLFLVCAPATSVPGLGRVVAISAATGAVAWWGGGNPPDTLVAAAVAVSPESGFLAVTAAGGSVALLNATTGALLAAASLPGAAPPPPPGSLNSYPGFAFPPTVDADGVVYVAGGTDGYAWRVSLLNGSGGGVIPSNSPDPERALSAGATAAIVVCVLLTCSMAVISFMMVRKQLVKRRAGESFYLTPENAAKRLAVGRADADSGYSNGQGAAVTGSALAELDLAGSPPTYRNAKQPSQGGSEALLQVDF